MDSRACGREVMAFHAASFLSVRHRCHCNFLPRTRFTARTFASRSFSSA